MPPPPRNPRPKLDIPVQPYLPHRIMRYEEDLHPSIPRSLREFTTNSIRARRPPIPTIESRTKLPSKFKGEEMSFIKIDVFLRKLERYLKNDHDINLATKDISDYVLNSLDDYVFYCFDRLPKASPYLFAQFDQDLRARYVRIDYKDQLHNEYMTIKEDDDRLFNNNWTELKDYEAILRDISDRDKYLSMRESMNSILKKTMLIFTDIPYEQFAATAARINPSLIKTRKEKQVKEDKKTSTSDSTSCAVSKSKSNTSQQSSGARYRPTSGSKHLSSTTKPTVKELNPEISRQEADRLHFCRHCKEAGHLRRNCPKLQSSKKCS